MTDSQLRQVINLGYGALGVVLVAIGALVPVAGVKIMLLGAGMVGHASPSPGRVYSERKRKKPMFPPEEKTSKPEAK